MVEGVEDVASGVGTVEGAVGAGGMIFAGISACCGYSSYGNLGLGETDLVQRGPSFLKNIFPFFPVKSSIFSPSIRPSIVY